ncbi:hypothetical protein I7I48_08973 [Histoplasma ohiense]|nr:hypothetical protein I7I48_08973 [Histoplasma ohiense (nom. inval.)]
MQSMNVLMGADPAHDKLHHFETSWLFSPLVFGVLRLIIFLYCLLVLIIVFALESSVGRGFLNRQSFSYFTSLAFSGVQWYFLISGVHSLLYAFKGRSVLFDKWPRWLRSLHSLYYTTVVCYPFVVSAIYWSVLYGRSPRILLRFEVWENISKHALPPFFALFEIIFSTARPPPVFHLALLAAILLLYLGIAYITHTTQGFWVYPFLRPRPGRHGANVARYLAIIAAVLVLTFALVWGISFIRKRLVGSKTKYAKTDPEHSNAAREGSDPDTEVAQDVLDTSVEEAK